MVEEMCVDQGRRVHVGLERHVEGEDRCGGEEWVFIPCLSDVFASVCSHCKV